MNRGNTLLPRSDIYNSQVIIIYEQVRIIIKDGQVIIIYEQVRIIIKDGQVIIIYYKWA